MEFAITSHVSYSITITKSINLELGDQKLYFSVAGQSATGRRQLSLKIGDQQGSVYEWVGVQWTHSFQNKGSKWDHKESIYFISFLDIWSQALFKWSIHLLYSTVLIMY